MKFRTEIEISRSRMLIEHDQAILTIGSCFAENIARKLAGLYFKVLENPFGVLYNPASVLAALQVTVGERAIEDGDLVLHNGLWHSLLHHSIFSALRKEDLLARIRTVNAQTLAFLKEARHVLLTFGTAFVYRYRKSGRIAANCHKIPAAQFDRYRLSAGEVSAYAKEIIELLKKINPALHIIITVSPIRHLKDGLAQNQLSKATLIAGLHATLEGAAQTEYFPAYEIMVDDLRGYRFYEPNLTHPNEMAREYIYEKFAQTYFSSACGQTVAELEKLNKALAHRPLHPQSQAHRQFVQRQLKEIARLEKNFSYVDFSSCKDKLREI